MPDVLRPRRVPIPPRRFLILLPLLLVLPLSAQENAPKADEDRDEIIADTSPKKIDPAVGKFWAAVRQLQSGKPADLAAGRAALQAVSDLEYSHAQLLLGNCLLSGSYGFSKDARKAANLFRLAAERGNAFAKVSLGSCYATGNGIRKDEAKAVEWLTAALAPGADYSPPERPAPEPGAAIGETGPGVAGELANDPPSDSQATAHFLLAQILSRQGKHTDAQRHLVAAATAGSDARSGLYAAATQAAMNFAFGQGVPRDLAKANEMLVLSRRLGARQSARLIHNYVSLKMVDEFAVGDLEEMASEAGESQQSQLQLNIAATLGNRKSKEYNLAEAVKWYELAAENDQVWAMIQLGIIQARGELGKADPAKAFQWFEKAGGGEKLKHYLGVGNLAICYQNGFGTAKDPAKAAALFNKHKQADIIAYLGSIGRAPGAPLTYEEAAALNETWARQHNDPNAQYLLGARYLNGWGVKADREEGMKWLQKAAKANHGGALCQLGTIAEGAYAALISMRRGSRDAQAVLAYLQAAEGQLREALDYYRRGSEVGDVNATSNYAAMLQSGRGVPKDLVRAEALYRKCLQLEPDHANSHNNLGALYAEKLRGVVNTIDGESIRENRTQMLAHYEAAVRQQSAYAARNLGDAYYEGRLVPQDYQKAYGYYEQAADWGMPIVHYSLGYMHENGQGLPVTLTEAAYHYRLAALEGNTEALRRLINFYLTGMGVSLDLDRAIFWMQQMARLGNARVLTNMCEILLRKQNYADVIPLLRKMTDSTDDYIAGYAYDRLGLCYERGLGVKANPGRAKKYNDQALKRGNSSALTELAMQQMKQGRKEEALATFERAAPQSPDAAYALGQMYYFGTNVEQDKAKALKFIRLAANGNQVNALFFLAALTFNGEPDAPTLDQAIRYAQQAENSGHQQAAQVREKLEQRRKEKIETPEETARSRSL
jgi:TPR repeat protein